MIGVWEFYLGMTFSAGVLGERDPAGNGFTNSMSQ